MRAVSGPPVGAVLLAVALLTMPPPPRWRLQSGVSRRRPRPALVMVGAAVPAVILLPLSAAVAVALLIGMAALRRRRRRQDRQRTGEGQALAAALEVWWASCGSGRIRCGPLASRPTRQAVRSAARCAAVAARALLGADVAGGLQTMAAAAAPTHWERLAVCWRLAAEHGLAMSTLMRAAQRDIVERQRFTARVEAGLAGARATAAILAGLPVLGVLLGQLIGARPLAFLLGGGIGGALLVLGVLLICLGLAWSERITGRLTA